MTETSVLPRAQSSHRQTAAARSTFALGGVALCALALVATSTSPAYAYTPRAFGGCLPITWAVQPKVANYSTESVDVVASLYFSSDDVWDAADVASVTTRSFTVNSNVSSLQGRVWTVPSLNPGTYYVIVRVEATTTAGVLRTDWIPLRGTVTVN